MLTGAADFQMATQLFNSGLIDHFIVKNPPEMRDQLNTSIQKMQAAYFEQASYPLLHCINKKNSCLSEPSFWQFIHDFFNENGFSEYYLIDESGSFLFIDYSGRPTWLVVKSTNEIESFYNIAVDNEAPEAVVSSLQKKEKIPFFFTEQDNKVPVSNWSAYLHDAQPLLESKHFYYAIVQNHPGYDLDKNKILLHRGYLSQ